MNAADLNASQVYALLALADHPRPLPTILNQAHLIQKEKDPARLPIHPTSIRDGLNTLTAGGYAVRTGRTGGGRRYAWSITPEGQRLRGDL